MPTVYNTARIVVASGCNCDEILGRLDALEQSICAECCDCDDINNRLTNLETNVANIQTDISNINTRITTEVEDLLQRISIIESAVEVSDVKTAYSTTSQMLGLGASSISIGPTYNFWGVGTLTSNTQWSQNVRYNLVTPTQFPELAWYQGDPTIGTVWFRSGGTGTPTSMPIYIDSTGIYIISSNTQNVNAGTTFKFTQALILVNPSP